MLYENNLLLSKGTLQSLTLNLVLDLVEIVCIINWGSWMGVAGCFPSGKNATVSEEGYDFQIGWVWQL